MKKIVFFIILILLGMSVNADKSIFYLTKQQADAAYLQQVYAAGTEPSCNIGLRGTKIYVAGGLGVADVVKVCMKTVLDTYVWTISLTGGG